MKTWTITRLHQVVLVAVACVIMLGRTPVAAQPLVTGDSATIYYNFDSFTDVVMDGSGNDFNGQKARQTLLAT